MKLYMFRTVRLSIIRSLFTVHSAMVYVIQICRQLLSRSICSCSKAVYKPVWHIPLLSVQWINSWWWTDELSETCTASWQNKFVKLVQLVGFITKKFDNFVYICKYVCHYWSLHPEGVGPLWYKYQHELQCCYPFTLQMSVVTQMFVTKYEIVRKHKIIVIKSIFYAF